MRKVAAAAALVGMLSVAGCDGKALQVTSCALNDSRLSIAFKDPRRARSHLTELANGLEHKDPASIDDAADLVKRIVGCLPD